jgi:hypothetical protein
MIPVSVPITCLRRAVAGMSTPSPTLFEPAGYPRSGTAPGSLPMGDAAPAEQGPGHSVAANSWAEPAVAGRTRDWASGRMWSP